MQGEGKLADKWFAQRGKKHGANLSRRVNKKLQKQRNIKQAPVLDKAGIIKKLHYQELVKEQE